MLIKFYEESNCTKLNWSLLIIYLLAAVIEIEKYNTYFKTWTKIKFKHFVIAEVKLNGKREHWINIITGVL